MAEIAGKPASNSPNRAVWSSDTLVRPISESSPLPNPASKRARVQLLAARKPDNLDGGRDGVGSQYTGRTVIVKGIECIERLKLVKSGSGGSEVITTTDWDADIVSGSR